MASAISQNLSAANRRKMVSEISNRQTIMWVAVAFVFHVVLIGATSLSYIHDRWIDPAGAAARVQAADAAEAQKLASDSAPPTATQSPVPPPAQTDATTPDEKKILDQRRDNPEVKKVTEAAKPGEIPKNPTHQGFDLDDSSLK
jgi:hypothetical protein